MSAPVPTPNHVEPGFVLPRTAWSEVLTETTVAVFSIMVGVHVTVNERNAQTKKQVTGIVGIGGAMRANFILQCSHSSAVKLAAKMLGITPDSSDSQKAASDALGEICNIIAGHFKAKIGLGDACMLSVPAIITGEDYNFYSRAFDRLEIPLAYDGEILWAVLEIAQ